MNKSRIAWTDYTWNPVTGCTKVSEGCKFCYAEKKATNPFYKKAFPNGFNLTLHPERLDRIKSKTKYPPGSKVFVNSMSDLFHEDIPIKFIYSCFLEMYRRPDVTFQILTKRPERMIDFFRKTMHPIKKNMWLGVSVESTNHQNRIRMLLDAFNQCQYVDSDFVTFVSFEPLLEDLGQIDLTGLDWIIVGGESGPNRRPFKLKWAYNLLGQARKQNVKFFFKQTGDLRPGSLKDVPDDLIVREFPQEIKAMEAIL